MLCKIRSTGVLPLGTTGVSAVIEFSAIRLGKMPGKTHRLPSDESVRRADKMPVLRLVRHTSLDDLRETARVETGAADERAINVRLGQ
jgi:hypothetical protein